MSRAEELADYAYEYAITAKDEEVAKELRRLSAVEAELIALKKAISEAEPVAIMWRGRDKGPWRFCNALGNWPLDPAVFTETEADPLYTLKGIK